MTLSIPKYLNSLYSILIIINHVILNKGEKYYTLFDFLLIPLQNPKQWLKTIIERKLIFSAFVLEGWVEEKTLTGQSILFIAIHMHTQYYTYPNWDKINPRINAFLLKSEYPSFAPLGMNVEKWYDALMFCLCCRIWYHPQMDLFMFMLKHTFLR